MIARWLIVAAVCGGVGGCKKEAAPAASEVEVRPAAIPAAEIQRGKDACQAYVAKICACTAPGAPQACGLARALVDAVDTGLEIAASPDSSRLDVLQTQDHVRKTIKECVEEIAKLPTIGC